MRVLVTSCPGYGHLYPLIPLSWALHNAGHDVLIAQTNGFAPIAAATGLPAAAIGGDVRIKDVFANADHSLYRHDTTAALIDHVTGHYPRLAEHTAADLVELSDEWQPDVVLQTPWEYAGPIVAARRGIPLVRHTWGVALPAELAPAEALALAPLHERWGQPADPALLVDICPPDLQYPDAPDGIPMAYSAYNGSAVLPAWLRVPPRRPRICVTLGTMPVPGEHELVLRTVLSGLASLDAELVVITGGTDVDPPANARVVDWLPLNQVLATCDLVVHHGGSGTTMTSFAAGLPQLTVPQMCDQHRHADRATAVGAATTLVGADVSPGSVRSHASRLLTDLAPRQAAEAIRDQMRRLPRPADVVPTVTALVEAT